jgi:putative heme iron utilization protein
MSDSAANEVRQFLRRTRSAVLSTHSKRFEGYPFGSIAPFVLDQDGNPLILISTIAEHTKNISANPKVSLIAFDPAAPDMQAGARLTLLGEAHVANKQDSYLRQRYLRYFPQAAQYFDMHDFLFHRIAISQARYIGGFGNIHWIEGAALLPPPNQLAGLETGILEHMNHDHADSLIAYCHYRHGFAPESAEMVGVDSDGFDLRANNALWRFDFETPVTDAQSARAALVALSKAAKA